MHKGVKPNTILASVFLSNPVYELMASLMSKHEHLKTIEEGEMMTVRDHCVLLLYFLLLCSTVESHTWNDMIINK